MHYCYVLYNDVDNTTYNGYTNNLERRIRQHNNEIKGGARYTTSRTHKIKWKYLYYIESSNEEFTYNKALSFEWHLKYPNNKRPRPKEFQGVIGRINSLPLVLSNDKFKDINFTIKCCQIDHLEKIEESITNNNIINAKVEYIDI